MVNLRDNPGFQILLQDFEALRDTLDTVQGVTNEKDLGSRQGALGVLEYLLNYVEGARVTLLEDPTEDDGTNPLEDWT